ncbi:MAG: glycoside hydrolase family 88 protein [Candidatus Pristimantibacillus sp.]
MGDEWITSAWAQVTTKIDLMIEQLGDRSPHRTVDGIYDDMRLDWWTSGFWPGMLWIMHDRTGDARYRNEAWAWDERFEQCFLKESNLHHDVGFQFLPTAVMKYIVSEDRDGRRRGLAAANFLAGRYNLKGQFLRAWNLDRTGWAIIDSAMNLSLLFWASQETGDPRYRHIAVSHADTIIRNFIREDGSVCHIVSFNPETGEYIEELGGQGFAAGSSWSRGQAWAIYGMANAYRYTRDVRFLHASQRVAHYFLSALPKDGIPPWDFRAVSLEKVPKDTSAAAIAASGLLELSAHLNEAESNLYLNGATRMLQALTSSYTTWDRKDQQGILLEGTGNKPAEENVNVSLIYGDYFYVEALAKLKGWRNRIF